MSIPMQGPCRPKAYATRPLWYGAPTPGAASKPEGAVKLHRVPLQMTHAGVACRGSGSIGSSLAQRHSLQQPHGLCWACWAVTACFEKASCLAEGDFNCSCNLNCSGTLSSTGN